jgi:hypothetical protein
MRDSIQELIDAMREELQQYGEMLALLDRQQKQVVERAGDEVLHSVRLIQSQGTAIETARLQREKCRKVTAKEFGQAETAGFATLIPLLPPDYQPLLKALVDENNECLARQNHLLLSRSLELMQGFINTLFATQDTRVYDDRGGVQKASAGSRSLYEGVG